METYTQEQLDKIRRNISSQSEQPESQPVVYDLNELREAMKKQMFSHLLEEPQKERKLTQASVDSKSVMPYPQPEELDIKTTPFPVPTMEEAPKAPNINKSDLYKAMGYIQGQTDDRSPELRSQPLGQVDIDKYPQPGELKQKPVYASEAELGDYLTSFPASIAKGVLKTVGSMMQMPAKIKNQILNVTAELANKIDEYSVKDTLPTGQKSIPQKFRVDRTGEDVGKAIVNIANDLDPIIVQAEKGIYDSLKDGDISNASANISDLVGDYIPQLIVTYLGGFPAVATTIGSETTVSELNRMEDMDRSEIGKSLIATGKVMSELTFEKVLGFGRLSKLFDKAKKKAVKSTLFPTLKGMFIEGAKQAPAEGTEEGLTQLTNNVIDIMAGDKDWSQLWEGVPDAVTGGLFVGGIGGSLTGAVRTKADTDIPIAKPIEPYVFEQDTFDLDPDIPVAQPIDENYPTTERLTEQEIAELPPEPTGTPGEITVPTTLLTVNEKAIDRDPNTNEPVQPTQEDFEKLEELAGDNYKQAYEKHKDSLRIGDDVVNAEHARDIARNRIGWYTNYNGVTLTEKELDLQKDTGDKLNEEIKLYRESLEQDAPKDKSKVMPGKTVVDKIVNYKDKAVTNGHDILSVAKALDGKREGTVDKLFWQNISDGYNESLKKFYEVKDNLASVFGRSMESLRGLGRRLKGGENKVAKKLAEIVELPGDRQLTNNQALSIYRLSLVPENRTRMLEGGIVFEDNPESVAPAQITEDDLRQITELVTTDVDLKKLNDAIDANVNGILLKQALRKYNELKTRGYGKQVKPENFLIAPPIRSTWVLNRGGRPSIGSRNLRWKDIPTNEPVKITGVYEKALDDAKWLSDFANMEESIEDANKFLDENYNVIIEKKGRPYADYLRTYLEDISDTGSAADKNNVIADTLRWLRKKNTQAAFFGNLPVFLSQPISAINAIAVKDGVGNGGILLGIGSILQSGLNVITSPSKIYSKWSKLLPSLRERFEKGPHRDIAEFKKIVERKRKGLRGKAADSYDALMDTGLAGMRYMDTLTVLSIAEAVELDYRRKNNITGEFTDKQMREVVNKAQRLISRTQIASRNMDRAQYLRSKNEGIKLITMYSGAISKYRNTAVDILSDIFKKGASIGSRTESVYHLAFLFGFTYGLFGLRDMFSEYIWGPIKNAIIGDDDDEPIEPKNLFYSRGVDIAASTFPVAGKLASPLSSKLRYERAFDPSIPIQSSLGFTREAVEGRYQNAAARAAETITGVPVYKIFKKKKNRGGQMY